MVIRLRTGITHLECFLPFNGSPQLLVYARDMFGQAGATGKQCTKVSLDALYGFLQIVNASPLLGLAQFTYRPDAPTRPVIEALARRMGIAADDLAVRILFDTWAVLMGSGLGGPGATVGAPAEIADRIEETFAVFTRLWRPWRDPQGDRDPTRTGKPGR